MMSTCLIQLHVEYAPLIESLIKKIGTASNDFSHRIFNNEPFAPVTLLMALCWSIKTSQLQNASASTRKTAALFILTFGILSTIFQLCVPNKKYQLGVFGLYSIGSAYIFAKIRSVNPLPFQVSQVTSQMESLPSPEHGR